MDQYWINRAGVQTGPVTLEEVKQMNLDGDTYIWYNGLDDWTKLSQLPNLASQVLATEPTGQEPPAPEPEQPAPVEPAEPEEPAALEPQEEPEGYDFEPGVPTTPPEAPAFDETTLQPAPQVPVGAPAGVPVGQPVIPMGQVVVPTQPQAMAPAVQPQPAPFASEQEDDKCPPTNLWWGIATAVLCCLPLSLVAIFMGLKAKKCWNAGDRKGAQKWSDISAWTIIASVISSIVLQPVVMLIQFAIMG